MGLLEDVKKLVFGSEETEEQFVDVMTDDGRTMRVDDLAEGQPVMEVIDGEVVEVEDGTYLIVDSEGNPTANVTVEGGVISAIENVMEEEGGDETEEEMSEETEEESKDKEEETKEEMEDEVSLVDLKDAIVSIAEEVASIKENFDKEKEELKAEFEKKIEEFKKAPSEEHTKTKKEFSLTDSNKKGKKSSPIFYAGK